MSKTYLVGGAVRDLIINNFNGIDLTPKDLDYVYVTDNKNMSPEDAFDEMALHMRNNNYEIFLEHKDTYTIRARNNLTKKVADYVLARKEIGYHTNTRKPILEVGTLFDDLERRDFTINAIAMDDNNNYIDPFNGIGDISKRILKTPLEAEKTMLDDPLRLLRALRFSITKNFEIDKKILECFGSELIMEKLFNVVSIERIREELNRMFVYDTVKTLNLMFLVENFTSLNIPFMEKIFGGKMWLQPTLKST